MVTAHHGEGDGDPQIMVSSNFIYNVCNLYLNTGFVVPVVMIPARLKSSIIHLTMLSLYTCTISIQVAASLWTGGGDGVDPHNISICNLYVLLKNKIMLKLMVPPSPEGL